MILKEVFKDCDFAEALKDNDVLGDSDISGISYDSRTVEKGHLFTAIKGEKYDGHDFIRNAIQRGAVVIVHEKEIAESGMRNEELHGIIPFVRVENGRRALSCIANNFNERPSERIALTGITGTNGKTTTTYILKSILEQCGHIVGLIGTIRYMIKDKVFPAVHTTPESPEFQGLLKKMILAGCTHVISEVSSHALAQYRVDGTVFHTAIFTNLTRDHLDFHKTMEEYFRSKKRLFSELLSREGTAVINIDDPYGKVLYDELLPVRWMTAGLNIYTYGLKAGADIFAYDIDNSFQGLKFKVLFQGKILDISSPLTGIINVYNILAAIGAAVALTVPDEAIIEGINTIGAVPGRFEKVDLGQKFLCIVDYAHTEDAIERLIRTARELLHKSPVNQESKEHSFSPRIITVFGCGGDRDKGKRPVMGRMATGYSDFVFITSDNPRSEDPMDIIRDIEAGAVNGNYIIEPDRKEAIGKAVDMAMDGDIVLIAGKGHEDYQEVKGARLPFNDKEVLREAINIKLKMKKLIRLNNR
jgi:UDP-N-acetylmuramoyl-L-alanyl-D-glutamate--2,6-diaminopimelate ligase